MELHEFKQFSSGNKHTPLERQEMVLESIKELEEMYEQGEIEKHSYFIKKRALIKML